VPDRRLAAEMVEAMGGRPVVVLRGHGITSGENSVAEAVLRAVSMDQIARLSLTVASAGGVLRDLPEADLAELPDRGPARSQWLARRWDASRAASGPDGPAAGRGGRSGHRSVDRFGTRPRTNAVLPSEATGELEQVEGVVLRGLGPFRLSALRCLPRRRSERDGRGGGCCGGHRPPAQSGDGFDAVKAHLANPRSRLMFDDDLAGLVRAMSREGIVEPHHLAVTHAGQAEVGSGLVTRPPAFVAPPMTEILDLRRDLQDPLTNYRAAVLRLADRLTTKAYQAENVAELDDLWTSDVQPALVRTGELSNESVLCHLLSLTGYRSGIPFAASAA
jgi:hypothetical protein